MARISQREACRLKRRVVELERALQENVSLRDYFAGQALAGGVIEFYRSECVWDDYDDFAQTCFSMADAMCKRREK